MSTEHHCALLEDGEITEDETVVAPLPSPKPPTPPLTPHQLDQAKDLVLDLLGWGVTPEYLVDCGVSSQALYRIFGDLRLRLPKNIDRSRVVDGGGSLGC